MTALRIMLACLLISPVFLLAQAPINEQVKVEFTSSVAMGDKVLAPGKYEIRRLSTANNPLIFEVISEEGTRTEVTASAIPLVDNLARRPTSVILGNKGNTKYVSQLWIAGETYGYEFKEPDQIEQAATPTSGGDTRLTATYKADTQAADKEREAQLAAERKREEDRLRAEGERQARAELERQRQQEAERAAAERERAERERQQQIAQAKPAEPPPQTPPAAPPAKTGGARQMPKTADGWPALIFGGLSLFSAGFLVRRLAH